MQKHVIKRQIIELSVPDRLKAQQLQTEVSRIYRQRIVPLLDQLCTELSVPDRIHRIERLEVDLGQLDPDQLERELVDRAGQALRQTLAREIKQQERTGQPAEQQPQTRSQLELLAFFLRTGSLPWWAEVRRPRLLTETLQFLIKTAPDPLRRLIANLARSDTPLRRLAQNFEDESLSRLVVVLVQPPTETFADDLQAFITLLTQTTRIPSNLLRQQLWLSILHLSSQAPRDAARPASLYQAVLTQLAVHFGIAYPALLNELDQRLQATTSLPETLKIILQTLLAQDTSLPSARLSVSDISATALADLIATLRTMANHLPDQIRGQLLAELNNLAQPSISGPARNEIVRRIVDLVAAPLEDPAWAAAGIPPDIVAMARTIARTLDLEIVELTPYLQKLQSQPQPDTNNAPDLSFSEADELYIHNAGLVILWPFLTRFFEKLDLLNERRFKDEAAQQRATATLQYLVYPEERFPEYLLPLNKLLCGLELSTVFEFNEPLTALEIEICSEFLEAVISQVPILKNMSVAGLRGTFLLRPGILTSRDGAWLLRVERETYDIVLDKFPWSWQWVKLPWMAAPLRVEW